ncbi:MAG: mercuric reductase [Microcoleus sp. PH2017_10_PVI_O_A]|uniref:mercuric reductase n=1 Tax=unclassified Microcoleus TaxID=2642155 RepID=UPI001D1FC679|nr:MULTISPECIES: mercuric reductase [unclassified Microcoleus]TAE82291.1 MAG: mercuric reductase [Oscillatoriales cyanobacterium]MCC3406815.1 mercuric reductase [Microcoleus sp. PH2017_10_PVI_O_A]MCC3460950.1 mercuric reductase [Microcoleus sp. PH2017_11_PCY_U_A]MCC3479472.1 mercuric reductase [Microcoleus sp. PH2017_12_PCY_D_A]MCC3526814.1 mercuric reductase [Microcoleus sp. PH2017_21_RUC_O_A]
MSQSKVDRVTVPPMDEHNQKLVSYLHPPDWVNPQPASSYNLVVIGAGPAGLIVAAGAAGLGAKVALIEKHLMGGDCLNVGCVPSKALIRSARAVGDIWNASKFGVNVPNSAEVDFAAVMERLRRIRAGISDVDSVDRYQHTLGVDVFLGSGSFTSNSTIEVAGQTLRFKKAVITTGARARLPQIPGLQEAGYLTNETVFNLTEKPQRLAVIGGGPIGCELAQAFRRLGSEVVLLHKNAQILDKEDVGAATIVQQAFVREEIQLILESKIERVEKTNLGKVIYYQSQGKEASVTVDEIIVSAGRSPNVEGLNLEAVGVEYDTQTGVFVNDNLQTTNPRIYAAGDICMKHKFTHAADFAARMVIQNTLFFGRKKLSALTVPWCTYTDPEVARVGLGEAEAKAQGIDVDTFLIPFSKVDRAIIDGEEEGFVKIHVKKGSDKILGATIVARHAGDMISEITLAMVNNIGLGKIASTIHPYPTQAEAIRKAGDAYNRTRLTPFVKNLFNKWLAWTR